MGALHAGHLALVAHAVAENDVTVVSIFVNPTQFNDKNDLKNYPRTPEADCELLANAGVSIVFMPTAEEVYPTPDTRQFEFGALATVMEGAFRPGHFNGVAQIVSRLFEIVAPDRAYFGEKDFQQLAIIREMVKHLQLDVQIVACPIVREADGLAMSSRNARLTAAQRQAAVNISRVLLHSRGLRVKPAMTSHTDAMTGSSNCHCGLDPQSLEGTRQWVTEQVNAVPELQVEYFAIVDGTTLQPIKNWADSAFPVGCIAVFDGDVRLIDTVFYA
ncbi:pantothenate synthetase [Bacteroidia bacterium]|nr:pantothenate synthetase [Bacteroidia bacterium]